jgi:hypothetical protein
LIKRPKTEEWRSQANCHNAESEVFFPPQITIDSVHKAFSYCKPCPVKTECLHLAVVYSYEGIWGCSTQGQRNYILKTVFNNDITDFTFDDALLMEREIKSVSVKMRSSKRRRMDT